MRNSLAHRQASHPPDWHSPAESALVGLVTHFAEAFGQAVVLIRDLGSLDFVGADLVEVWPPFDAGSIGRGDALAKRVTDLFALVAVGHRGHSIAADRIADMER